MSVHVCSWDVCTSVHPCTLTYWPEEDVECLHVFLSSWFLDRVPHWLRQATSAMLADQWVPEIGLSLYPNSSIPGKCGLTWFSQRLLANDSNMSSCVHSRQSDLLNDLSSPSTCFLRTTHLYCIIGTFYPGGSIPGKAKCIANNTTNCVVAGLDHMNS